MPLAPDRATDLPELQRCHVLVVDDDQAVCEVIRRAVERGFPHAEIKIVYDGISAVNELDRKIDLLILDLGLPQLRGEGVSLANELKGCNSPILVITGEPNPDLAFMGDINVMGLLKKPFDIDDLLKAVRMILSGEEYPSPA